MSSNHAGSCSSYAPGNQ